MREFGAYGLGLRVLGSPFLNERRKKVVHLFGDVVFGSSKHIQLECFVSIRLEALANPQHTPYV